MGVQVAESFVFPFKVAISIGDIGGPSAGMMFALGIIDKITPADLTGGRFIAGHRRDRGQRQGRPDRRHPAEDGRRPGRGRHGVPRPGGQLRRHRRAPCRPACGVVKVSTLNGAVTALNALRQGKPVPSC